MSTMSISALEILEQSEMPSAHARAIAKAIEADFAHRLDDLATKADLSELKAELKADLTQLSAETKSVMAQLRAEIKGDMGQLGSDLRSEIQREMHGVQIQISNVRTEISSVRIEISHVRAEMFAIKGELVRWIFLAVMGQTTLLSGIMYFLLRVASP